MFVNGKGRPMSVQGYEKAWKRFIKPTGACFPPQKCRHIFVHERRSDGSVPGPNDADAAMIMGNSVREWDKSYHLNFRKDKALKAVQSMQGWRQALLTRSGASHFAPEPSAVDTAGAASGSIPSEVASLPTVVALEPDVCMVAAGCDDSSACSYDSSDDSSECVLQEFDILDLTQLATHQPMFPYWLELRIPITPLNDPIDNPYWSQFVRPSGHPFIPSWLELRPSAKTQHAEVNTSCQATVIVLSDSEEELLV